MTDQTLLSIALSLVATFFGLLVALIAFGGTKVLNKLDAMVDKLNDVASELHQRINGIDRRVTVMETRCSTKHNLEQ
jgi:biopolymer transport protein ExbB/TolQ